MPAFRVMRPYCRCELGARRQSAQGGPIHLELGQNEPSARVAMDPVSASRAPSPCGRATSTVMMGDPRRRPPGLPLPIYAARAGIRTWVSHRCRIRLACRLGRPALLPEAFQAPVDNSSTPQRCSTGQLTARAARGTHYRIDAASVRPQRLGGCRTMSGDGCRLPPPPETSQPAR